MISLTRILGLGSQDMAGAPGPKTADLLRSGQPVTIVCFGDSVTGVYYHSGGRRAWSDVLEYLLHRIYPSARVTVINAGVSGNTSGQGLARMEADVLSHRPQLVVAMFGLNDVARGRGPREFRDHLAAIVTRARGAGAEIILMTPNSIYPGDPERPPLRVAEYAEVVRAAGRELNVPVADAFGAFESIRTADPGAWEHLMSDTIHPNLEGHKLLAEEAAWTISGQRLRVGELAPLNPAWPRVLSRVRARQPVRIVAMRPYDQLIASALRAAAPSVKVEVTTWDPGRRLLPAMAKEAQGLGRFKDREPDLFILAVPAGAGAADEGDYYRAYSAVLNGTLPFGPGGWDYLAVLPSVDSGRLNPAQHRAEELAIEAIRGKDVPWLGRGGDESTSAADLLARRTRELLGVPAP